jgi:hypothetical protein
MPQLTIPIGSVIDQNNTPTIKIRVQKTRFWIEGVKKGSNTWDIFMTDAGILRELLKSNISTKNFAIFTNTTLNTPFPYIGKRASSSKIIKKFIKKITKQKHGNNRKRHISK